MRLKLFNAVVTPTFLYGSGAWTLRKEAEVKIRSAQRRMLRWILGAGRRPIKAEQADSNSSGGSSGSSLSYSESGSEPEPENFDEESFMVVL